MPDRRFTDTRVPDAEHCVVRSLLERCAREHPNRVFARFASGAPDWTFGELRRNVLETANALKRLGVRHGDRVLCWMGTGRLPVRSWLALNYIGATYVPLNVAYRGALLEHVIRVPEVRVMLADAALLERLATSSVARLEKIVVVNGEVPAGLAGAQLLPEEALYGGDETLPALSAAIEPWDNPAIIFTSGTTGPSKAVLTSYAHLWATTSNSPYPTDASDRTLLHLPMFHVAGLNPIYRTLATGGSIAVVEQFRSSTFWGDVRATGATFANVMGSIASFLLSQPVTDDERKTPLRHAILSPLNDDCLALARRVGFDYHTVFNMTEISRPIMSRINPTKHGICGKPRGGVEVRVVDEHDCEVRAGDFGELVVRCDAPWAMSTGYFGDPEATARAWRNGWFHTGDGFRIDGDGEYIFVDRIKDAIRRRGENISSFEVEAEVGVFPGVRECAAVAVSSPQGDDEVMIVVEPVHGMAVDPAELTHFLIPRMPHYMVPRYVRLVDSLPRTETQRVQKALLRQTGITPDTWDREVAGIVVRRDLAPINREQTGKGLRGT